MASYLDFEKPIAELEGKVEDKVSELAAVNGELAKLDAERKDRQESLLIERDVLEAKVDELSEMVNKTKAELGDVKDAAAKAAEISSASDRHWLTGHHGGHHRRTTPAIRNEPCFPQPFQMSRDRGLWLMQHLDEFRHAELVFTQHAEQPLSGDIRQGTK